MGITRAAFVAALLSASVLALTTSATAQERPTVRYQEYPGSALHLVNWVMKEKGFCEKQGIKCETVLLASGPLAQQAAAARSVDIILSSMDVMLQAVANGHDLMILGTLVPNSVYFLAVRDELAKPNLQYPENIKHLKGKKIGVSARGSGVEMYAKALLAGAGISSDEVTFVAVGSASTAYAALAADQVDAAVTWDPVPAICEATGKCSILVDMRKKEGPPALSAMSGGFVVWQATRDYAEKNANKIDAFLRAQAEATKWMRDPKNYEEVLAIAKNRFQLGDSIPEKEKVIQAIVKEGLEQVGNNFDKNAIDAFNRFLVANNVLKQPVKADGLVYKNAP